MPLRTWRCEACGALHRGTQPPASCPHCGAPAEQMTLVEAPSSPGRIELVEELGLAGPPGRWACPTCGYEHAGAAPPDTCPVCGTEGARFTVVRPQRPREPGHVGPQWRCGACGYVHQGELPPALCPVCSSPAERFHPLDTPPLAEEEPAAVPSPRQLLVLGAGVAGVTAAERARELDPSAEIVLVSREPGLPCKRLQLPAFIAGELPAEELVLRQQADFQQKGIRLWPGEVVELDSEAHAVTLADGSVLRYDRLLLATGAHPFRPPIRGLWRDGVYPLRTLAQAEAIAERAQRGQPAVVIGGGLLGLELAAALQRRGMEVTVLEEAPWLLPRQLARRGGEIVARYLEELGLRVRTGASVVTVEGDESVAAVRLAGPGGEPGEALPARLVLLSTGIEPNAELARRAGLRVGRGVIVDEQLRTSDPDVLAAGDVAEFRGRVYGLWTVSSAQGRVAGEVLAGGDARFEPPTAPTTLDVLGLGVFSAGEATTEGPEVEVLEREEPGQYARLVLRDGRLVGASLVGSLAPARALRRAIEQRLGGDELRTLLEGVAGR